jgi:hypothetical protein
MGSTSLSKMNSSLSSTQVFASLPLLTGIDLGVGCNQLSNSYYWSLNNEVSLASQFVVRSLISKFFYELISLDVDVLSEWKRVGGLDVSRKVVLCCLRFLWLNLNLNSNCYLLVIGFICFSFLA